MKKIIESFWSFILRNKKNVGFGFLAVFATLQIVACFVAAYNTTGFVSFLFYLVGGLSCLFGVALDFLLLIIAVDIFGSIFGTLASDMTKRQMGDTEEVEEPEENDA